MSAPKKESATAKSWEIKGSWAGAWKIFAGIGALGVVGSGVGYTMDARRFAFSWLFAFMTVLTIALGAIFFVLIQRLTSAGWSVTVRRTAEFFGNGILVMIPLFIPVLMTMGHLFPWLGDHGAHGGEHAAPAGEHHGSLNLITPAYAQEPKKDPDPHGGTRGEPARGGVDPAGHLPGAAGQPPHDKPTEHGSGQGGGHGAHEGPGGGHGDNHGTPAAHGGGHAAPAAHGGHGGGKDPHALVHAELIQKKAGYLNKNFFLIRAFLYFVVWALLAIRLLGYSTAQDKSKNPELTLKAQRFAPPATFLFALTLTGAAVDWVMSLEPTWFSTIFGVVIFACGVVSSLAVMILVTLSLRSSGGLAGAVTVEHYHDLGKLMFGFLVFWAYVSFSQYMLIWYAALPEETTFFHNRMDHEPWSKVTTAIILFHFVVPFFWTISRNFKRHLGRLQIGAGIILVMHVVDIYWYVMPNYMLGKEGFSFHWLDATCLLAVAGVYGAFVFYRMTQFSLVPVGDPRLERALHFQNA